MAISRELFLAILAMDAYNRGYNSGVIKDPSKPLEGVGGQRIGNAQILRESPSEVGSPERAASFFAISYRWGSETVISYRGTDDTGIVSNVLLRGDIGNGWVTGAGFIGTQASLAQEFFKTVVQGSAPAPTNLSELKSSNDATKVQRGLAYHKEKAVHFDLSNVQPKRGRIAAQPAIARSIAA